MGLLLLIVLSFLYVSFDLYISTKNAQQEAQAVAEQMAVEAAKGIKLSRQLTPLTFTRFLQYWRDGQNKGALETARYLTGGSKEQKAAMFLLNPKLLNEKEADFRQTLAEKHAWFADFIIAENRLKNGKRQEALEAYQRSYQAIQNLRNEQSKADMWLAERIKAKLYELEATDRPAEDTPIIEGGD